MKYYIILSLLFTGLTGPATAQDKDLLVKEFNKVMAFSIQPYLHYATLTKMAATPVLEERDTLTQQGEFYKNGSNMYCRNMQTELFIEDSLYIEIDHNRKSIRVSKVDADPRRNINMMPLDNKAVQELFKKRYEISREKITEFSNRLNFETSQYFDSVSSVIVHIGLQYSGKLLLPEIMDMEVKMKQRISEAMKKDLEEEGTDMTLLIQQEGVDQFLVRTQRVTVTFATIDQTREKASQIPSWKRSLSYDTLSDEFVPVEKYNDYEVTKTF